MTRRFSVVLLSLLALVAASCSQPSEVTVADDATTSTTANSSDSEGDGIADDEILDDAESDSMGEDGDGGDDGAAPTTTAPAEERPEQSASTVAVPAGVPADQGAELAAAAAAGDDLRFASPYFYITAEQSCDGCFERVQLYYAPREDVARRHRLIGAYVDGAEQSLDGVTELLRSADPLFIAESLLEQIAAGGDVTYRVDGVSGIVTSWSVGAESVTLRCFQVDTRPLDMRTVACEGSLIG